jgi:quercetin dioxygenase-like cupin family protein
MNISDIPFGITDWQNIETIEHLGESGIAIKTFGNIRVRMVKYSAGYKADHWCHKGHILLCLEGQLITELEDGRVFTLNPGMSYQVADGVERHGSSAEQGAQLFIVH